MGLRSQYRDHVPSYVQTSALLHEMTNVHLRMALDRRSALYQLDKKNKKIPIQFISKKLNETELKWNIVEKEAYAIFYSMMKLDHLLRDRYFILQTDSKILSHMNVDHKDKVKRWKIAIPELSTIYSTNNEYSSK